jgi:DNA-binding transcriptional LysR family regulator
MELRHLRYFAAIGATENVTRAARQLRVAQPALSQRVKDLEAELGLALFEPRGRGIRLTPAGHYYLAEVRQILERLEAAGDAARRIQRGEVGSLRLGILEALSLVEPLPGLLKEVRARLPGLHLKLAGMPSLAQCEALAAGTLDAGFVAVQPRDGELRSRPIQEIPILAMLPAGHPLADRSALRLADLESLDFIWPEEEASTSYWGLFREAFEGRSWRPRIVQEASSFATTASLVAAGFGCALGLALPPGPGTEGIVRIPIQDLDLRLRVHLVWHGGNPSPALERFLEVAGQSR